MLVGPLGVPLGKCGLGWLPHGNRPVKPELGRGWRYQASKPPFLSMLVPVRNTSQPLPWRIDSQATDNGVQARARLEILPYGARAYENSAVEILPRSREATAFS
jgi:hypothetical protein